MYPYTLNCTSLYYSASHSHLIRNKFSSAGDKDNFVKFCLCSWMEILGFSDTSSKYDTSIFIYESIHICVYKYVYVHANRLPCFLRQHVFISLFGQIRFKYVLLWQSHLLQICSFHFWKLSPGNAFYCT